jgi:methyltransferase (TIGR00027 family)
MKDNRASATAEVIAGSTLLLAADPRTASLVAPGAAQLSDALLLGGGARARFLRWSAARAWLRPAWHALEGVTHPGIVRHYWYRKRWIESRCQAALAEGVRRVVVVGAGFDTLALRLAPARPDVDWVEVDHPATQGAKRRALSRAGVPVPDTVRFVAADLARDRRWPAEVGSDTRSTLVVLEGVLMYLGRAEVEALLIDRLSSLGTGPVRAIFSYMVDWPHGRGGFRPSSCMVDAWLALQHEAFRWLQRPDELEDWLQRLGCRVVAHVRAPFDDPAASAPGAPAVLQGENLVEAVLGVPGGSTGRASGQSA